MIATNCTLFVNATRGRSHAKCFDSFPGTYGFHRAVWIKPGIAFLVEERDTFCKVLVNEGLVWLEKHQLEFLSSE